MLPGEDSTRVCLKRWVDFQEAEMGKELFPGKWMAALLKTWNLENTLEKRHLGDYRVHGMEK